jgi:beta-lactamase superfamily II metal-dependent hydrolase
MIEFPPINILDVGHGNCCILHDSGETVVIDAAVGFVHTEFLKNKNVHTVDLVLVSHADADHIAGIITLLNSAIRVKRVYLNPDALRKTKIWEDFRIALHRAKKTFGTEVHTELNSNLSWKSKTGTLSIEILGPSPNLCISGSGGQTVPRPGKKISANSMSAVVRVLEGGEPIVLLPGDLDSLGLGDLCENHDKVPAKVLVFPHHGGLPGSEDPAIFTNRLLDVVNPEVIIFSIGRGKHNNPRLEIVQAIREFKAKVSVMCTQLSQGCSVGLPKTIVQGGSRASGSDSRNSCAGTISIRKSGKDLAFSPKANKHLEFINRHVPNALCKLPHRGMATPPPMP